MLESEEKDNDITSPLPSTPLSHSSTLSSSTRSSFVKATTATRSPSFSQAMMGRTGSPDEDESLINIKGF